MHTVTAECVCRHSSRGSVPRNKDIHTAAEVQYRATKTHSGRGSVPRNKDTRSVSAGRTKDGIDPHKQGCRRAAPHGRTLPVRTCRPSLRQRGACRASARCPQAGSPAEPPRTCPAPRTLRVSPVHEMGIQRTNQEISSVCHVFTSVYSFFKESHNPRCRLYMKWEQI